MNTSGSLLNEYSTGLTAGCRPFGITSGPDGKLWFTEEAGNKIGKITTNGAVTEYYLGLTASCKPRCITAGPDGALWFTEYAADKIGRITIDGAITEYDIPTTGGKPYGITAHPGGDIWFTEDGVDGNNINHIGRVELDPTSHQFRRIVEYPIDTPNCGPSDITVGPNNDLYFTEYNVDKIGRLIMHQD
jgi:virginiamycin B lyase